jgi:hypothetical protein
VPFHQELAMEFIFYILFAVIVIGIIYYIVRGKRT